MTMNENAIKAIQASHATEAARDALNQHPTAMPLVALPYQEGMKITNLEPYMPGRVRYRGDLTTTSLYDYIRFCLEHDATGARCFVDPESMTAKAFLNLGTDDAPGHGDFTGTLTLKPTAEYKALLGIDGMKHNQKSLAEFMEDWAQFITPYDSEGQAIEVSKAISRVRRITIAASRNEDHETQDFRSSKSALETVEARSEEGGLAGFRFECVPYSGLVSHSFDLRLSIHTGGEVPLFTVRIKRLEQKQEEMGLEFMGLLQSGFKDAGLQTFMGAFSK